jgi:hypothetical protein
MKKLRTLDKIVIKTVKVPFKVIEEVVEFGSLVKVTAEAEIEAIDFDDCIDEAEQKLKMYNQEVAERAAKKKKK